MSASEIGNLIINGSVALGTIACALLAVFGDRAKAYLLGPKLRLVIGDSVGSMIPCGNGLRYYRQLKVENGRPSTIAMNCQVRLKHLSRKKSDGGYADIRLPYPLVMSWPPSEYTAWTLTVRREEPVDFGFLEDGKAFICIGRVIPNNFEAFLRAGETMRYGLEIVSDNFVSKKPQVFEVTWNGKWSTDPVEMAGHLQIREIAG